MLEIGRTFKSFHHVLSNLFNEEKSDLPFEQYIMLLVLKEKGEKIQKELAFSSGIHKATITRTIDVLESYGYVIRTQDKTDRRQNVIELTAEGNEVAKKYLDLIKKAEKEITDGIGNSEIHQCLTVLDKIWQNCEKKCN
jgi:DNA-binding MarR family transcriptional regulator